MSPSMISLENASDSAVTIFHRKGELSFLGWDPHSLGFLWGNPTFKHQPLGTATYSGEHRLYRKTVTHLSFAQLRGM
jgi:hypothetical protein